MSELYNNKLIKLASDISWQEYFGEVYIIKETIGTIYTLKDESVIFWNVIQKFETYNEINNECSRIMKDYDKESVLNGLNELLHQLKKYKIVKME